MYYKSVAIASLLAAPLASANPHSPNNQHTRRDSITWGPLIGLGPTADGIDIISATSTIYPGKMPSNQAGGLFNWIGLTNNTDGDLVQSIIGSYSAGQSECGTGSTADDNWCITSEVYGYDSDISSYNQWVGDLRTLNIDYEDGLFVNYTLIDRDSYLWLQNVHDVKTGTLMSTFNKTSGPMTYFNTAVECQDCTAPTSTQYWIDTTITLSAKDDNLANTFYSEDKAISTKMTTADGGLTWTIANITIPVVAPITE